MLIFSLTVYRHFFHSCYQGASDKKVNKADHAHNEHVHLGYECPWFYSQANIPTKFPSKLSLNCAILNLQLNGTDKSKVHPIIFCAMNQPARNCVFCQI